MSKSHVTVEHLSYKKNINIKEILKNLGAKF
jgi:hypothetical protein